MSVTALNTVTLNCVIILIGPSQLTHAWQANDQSTDKIFRKPVKKNITSILEMGVSCFTTEEQSRQQDEEIKS